MSTTVSESMTQIGLILKGFITLLNDLEEWLAEGELGDDKLVDVFDIISDEVNQRQKKLTNPQTKAAIEGAMGRYKSARTLSYTKRVRAVQYLRDEFTDVSSLDQIREVILSATIHLFKGVIAREVAITFPHPNRMLPIDAHTLQKHLAGISSYMGALSALSDELITQHYPFNF